MTHELWTTLNAKMIEFLDSVSLQDLVNQQTEQQLIPDHKTIVLHTQHHIN